MFKRLNLALMGSALLVLSCASRPPAEAEQVQELEYFLRWQHAEFDAKYAWHLLPAAHAELPPQYQNAFALRVLLDHAQKELNLSYHSQQVIDDRSHVHQTLTLGQSDYLKLTHILNQPIACQTEVAPGWVGPAPRLIKVTTAKSEEWIYAGGQRGPDGPGRKLSESNQRRYICNDALLTSLNDWIRLLETKK